MNKDNLQIQSVSGLAVDLPLVDIGGRSLAYIIDLFLSFFIAFGWLFLVAYIIGTSVSVSPVEAIKGVMEDDGKGELFVWIGIIPAYGFFFFYHPLLEWLMKGRTLGKKFSGIRIVMQDGTDPRFIPIMIRNIFRLIDSLPGTYLIGLVVAMFNKRHLRIGDMAAGTVLIYEDKPKKIDQYLEQHFSSNIPPKDLDLMIELNQRWNSLQRNKRVELTTRLLTKLEALPDLEGLSVAEKDRQLRKQIKTLLEG